MGRVGILVIDMLKDFIYGKLSSPRFKRIIPNIATLLSEARKRNIPIIFVNDAHIPDVDRELKLWGPHALKNTQGAEVINELKPQKGDYIVEKRRYSGFYSTDLDLLLRELGVDTLIVTGISTDVCVLHTVADAFFRNYTVVVVKDCVESFTEEGQKWALEYMGKVYGVKIVSLEEAIKMLGK